MERCRLCLRPIKATEELCKRHKARYLFDKDLGGYRLRKAKNGTAARYIKRKFHSHEIELTKILERFYGQSNIVTSFHPLWAVSAKGALLEYDIYIRNRNILIEYNGEQHYKFIKIFHKTLARFKAQQSRDQLKAKLAVDNGFGLLIVKFSEPMVEDYIVSKVERLKNGN